MPILRKNNSSAVMRILKMSYLLFRPHWIKLRESAIYLQQTYTATHIPRKITL